MEFGIYTENGQLELVCVIRVPDRDKAVERARALGYGKEYRVEELDDD